MKSTLSSFLFLFLVVACNNATNTETRDLKFRKFTILNSNNEAGPGMDEKGNILDGTKVVATMSPSGEITSAEGKLLARYQADTLSLVGNTPAKFRIDVNGTVFANGETTLHWNKDGALLDGNESTGLKISPNDADSYTNASIVFILYSSFEDPVVSTDTLQNASRSESTKPAPSDLGKLVDEFTKSAPYLSALKTPSAGNLQAALQNLFNEQRVLEFFTPLGDITKKLLADYSSALVALRDETNKTSLDVKQVKNLINTMNGAVGGYKIHGLPADKKLVTDLDALRKSLSRISNPVK